MIEKPTILVTSLGRTGTEFFSRFFANIIPDCTSLHEPDTIVLTTHIDNRFEQYVGQIRRAGVWRMTVLKALGKWSLVKLSDSRFLGAVSYRQAVSDLYGQRMEFVTKMPGSVYVEANLGYYGLLDVVSDVFASHRGLYIIRNGREWVRSMLGWGEVYGKKGIRGLFSHKWPAASDIPDDPYKEEWDYFSRFEKLCWAWARLNEYGLESAAKNPSVRVFRFEKIFEGEGKYEYLNDLMTFVASLAGITPDKLGRVDGWLERKTHQNLNVYPGWEKWNTNQKHQFERLCGPLMEKLGYEI